MAQVTVQIPPLRQRLDDLPMIVDDLLTQLGRPHMKVDEADLSALLTCSWPGNVRQLRTVVQAALVESDGDRLMLERALAGTSSDAKPERPSGLYDDAKRDFDRRFYTSLYVRYGGNLSKIAKAAGKQRVTVRAALLALGLHEGGQTPGKGA
jgi:DNA-binding NtrC family response regulator